MAKPLAVLAVGGLAISAVCLSLAGSFASAFPPDGHFTWRGLFSGRCTATPEGDSAATSRVWPWDGGDSVQIDIPADVHYQPGTSRDVTVRGAPETLRHVQIEDGIIAFDCHWAEQNFGTLDVTLPGSAMRSFTINGSGRLLLDNIKQDELKIAIHGRGDVRGSGEAERLVLTIAGSGDADLGRLLVKRVRTMIAGSGDVDVAPQDQADVVIAGSGNVRLHSKPKQLRSKVLGSGRVVSSAETTI
jgi:hypothetical protein